MAGALLFGEALLVFVGELLPSLMLFFVFAEPVAVTGNLVKCN